MRKNFKLTVDGKSYQISNHDITSTRHIFKTNNRALTYNECLDAGYISNLIDSQNVNIPIQNTVNQKEFDALKIKVNDFSQIIVNVQNEINRLKDKITELNSKVIVEPSLLVNINTATVEQLDMLPDWGLKTAQKIVDNRPFKDDSDMKTKINVTRTTQLKLLTKF
jgi:DNA uptake protein ComE-like DNA-binding protein